MAMKDTEKEIKNAMRQSKIKALPIVQESEEERAKREKIIKETVPLPIRIAMDYYNAEVWGSEEEQLKCAEETIAKLLDYCVNNIDPLKIGLNVTKGIKSKKEKRTNTAKKMFESPRVKHMMEKAVQCGGIKEDEEERIFIPQRIINRLPKRYRLKNWSIAQLAYFLRLLLKPNPHSKKRLCTQYLEYIFGVPRLGKYINEAYNYKIGRAWHEDIKKMFEEQ